jgi:hypothetical protein
MTELLVDLLSSNPHLDKLSDYGTLGRSARKRISYVFVQVNTICPVLSGASFSRDWLALLTANHGRQWYSQPDTLPSVPD